MRNRWIVVFVVLAFLFIGCEKKQPQKAEIPKKPAAPTSGEVQVEGAKLKFFTRGEGAVPCIVIHDAAVMDRIVSEKLRELFRFTFVKARMNQPSDSTFVTSSMDMNLLLNDIEQVRKAIGEDKVCVMGHSAGGLLALEYARKYPQHTRCAILHGTPPFPRNKKRINYWNMIRTVKSIIQG